MIFCKDKEIREQIKSDYKELENYKNSYNKKISLYNTYLDVMKVFEDGVAERNYLNKEDIENKKQVFQMQIDKIDGNLELLANLLKNIESTGNVGVEGKILNKYNRKYKEIKNNYINNCVSEENITELFINGLMTDMAKTLENIKEEYAKEMEKVLIEKENIQYTIEKKENVIQEDQTATNYRPEKENRETYLKNNDTLLISEKQGKVILPYRAEEVLEILNTENSIYSSAGEVIEDKFTRKFSDFKIQFASRYAETIKLARERENYSFIDAVAIATEMMKKKFLHPAIISACRTLNELDVYLDCLDKNELEDFKIFNVKYELYPMVVKSHNNRKRSKHKKNPDLKIFSKIKRIFKMDNRETDKAYDE